ncbi:MAG: hypothetical protein ACR2HM_04395 [Acidimicrobiales bacterium]
MVAATTVRPGPAPDGSRVGAAGFVHEAIGGGATLDEPAAPVAVTSSTAPRPTVPAPPPAAPSPPPPSPVPSTVPASTTSPARTGPTTNSTLLPAPGSGATPTHRWSKTANGVSVSLRMEPATPVAGQPVTFYVDEVTAPLTCCIVHLSFGDEGEGDLISGTAPSCAGASTSRTGLSITHTYAKPGPYEISLVVVTVPCQLTVVDGKPVPPPITGTGITACITVGPGAAGAPGCSPYNHFNPQSSWVPA